MKLRMLPALCAVLLLLPGCASLLERTYTSVEPHSSKFWESEAAGTLRAENYQDIVNDLLLLIGQHTETATLRLYNYSDDLTVAETLEQAAAEVRQETPMGAYAVEYITSSSQSQRGYYEISLQIGYRRTAEQIQAVVNATSTEALPACWKRRWRKSAQNWRSASGIGARTAGPGWRRSWRRSANSGGWSRRPPGPFPTTPQMERWD